MMELNNLKVVYEESEFISMLEVDGIQEDQEYIEVFGIFTPEIFAEHSNKAFRIGYKKCILSIYVGYSSYNRREPKVESTTYWVMEDFYDTFRGAYLR